MIIIVTKKMYMMYNIIFYSQCIYMVYTAEVLVSKAWAAAVRAAAECTFKGGVRGCRSRRSVAVSAHFSTARGL